MTERPEQTNKDNELEELLRQQLERKDERIAMLEAMLEQIKYTAPSEQPEQRMSALQTPAELPTSTPAFQGAIALEPPVSNPPSQAPTRPQAAQDTAPIRLPDLRMNVAPIAERVMAAAADSQPAAATAPGDAQAEPTARFNRTGAGVELASSQAPTTLPDRRRILPFLLIAIFSACAAGILARKMAHSTEVRYPSPLSVTSSPAQNPISPVPANSQPATAPLPERSSRPVVTMQAHTPTGPYIEPETPNPPPAETSSKPPLAIAAQRSFSAGHAIAAPGEQPRRILQHMSSHPSNSAVVSAHARSKQTGSVHRRHQHRYYRHRWRSHNDDTGDDTASPYDVLDGHPTPGWDEKADRWIDDLPP